MTRARKRAASDSHLDLLEVLHMAGGGTLLLFGVAFWLLGLYTPSVVVGSYGVLTLLTLVVLQFRPDLFRPVVWMHVVVVSLVPFGVSLGLGGLLASGAYMIWGLIGPLAALMFLGRRATWLAGGIFLVCLVMSATIPVSPALAWVTLPPRWLAPALGVANIAGASILCLGTLVWFVSRLRFEQERSDGLLLGVLPPSVSAALRARRPGRGDRQHGVSILIADVVDLEPLSQRLGAAEVADLLSSVFQHFEGLASRYPVAKVRTVGDAFLVVAGLPEPNPHHARDLALLALEMRAAVSSRRFAGHRVELRIGINSGPASPGVMGRRRFIYDTWGRAVSLAARLEASGKPGCILLTQDTWDRVRTEFRARSTGVRTSKSSGAIEIWELLDQIDVVD